MERQSTLPPDAEKTQEFSREEIDNMRRAIAIDKFRELTMSLAARGQRLCDFNENEAWLELYTELEELKCDGAIQQIVAEVLQAKTKESLQSVCQYI